MQCSGLAHDAGSVILPLQDPKDARFLPERVEPFLRDISRHKTKGFSQQLGDGQQVWWFWSDLHIAIVTDVVKRDGELL